MSQTQINRLLLVVVLFNLCALIGCHRGYYRRQADADARRLILEKANDPRWESSDGTIDIDPQSRMFDPFSADHPPIPPDDPASHQFMRVVDGKEGYPHWHANGDTNFVENPDWRSYLPVNENGLVVLTLERAYQLALIHSPELQEQRETLYLAALDVSLERFGFDTQMFAGFNEFFTTEGRLRSGNGGRSSSTLESNLGVTGGGINFERLGITGSTFAIGLANTILFNFAGSDTQSATSLIDFSIIQPLLRGAGRDRIMESLTQAERSLLANVRQLARFRRGFYLEIAIGRGSAAGLNRGGTFLGIPNSATLNAGGYLGLLEQQQRIRNQELNVRQLEFVLELFREYFLRDRLDAVQLKRFETSVYRQQRNLLDLITSYQTSLDRFKLDLGLPPDLDVVIDDSFLDQFELVSDQVNERLISIGTLREETGAALIKVDDLLDGLNSPDDWPTEVAQLIGELTPYLDRAESTLEKITQEDRRELESDFQKLESKLNERTTYLENLKAAIESGRIPSNVDPGLFELDQTLTPVKLRQSLSDPNSEDAILNRAAKVKSKLRAIKSKIQQFSQTDRGLTRKEAKKYIFDEFQTKIPGQLSEMNNLVLEMSLLQARARSNSIRLAEVDIESPQTIEIARCMRRDWMNARASLVDNFRNIEFVADQLESQFDLIFEGDVGNTGDNPFKLRYETGQLRGGIRFDAPIVRISERNQYREALIEYQQTQRQFYQFEDNVKRNLRDIVRNLKRNKVLFELDRRTVQVEIENVEINRYELEKPVKPGGDTKLGATTAQNLTNAIIGLNNAQNSFLGSWVEFEVLRRSLDFDMGTMQLDAAGDWIDPGKIDDGIGQRAASMMGIQLDCQFCQGVVAPLGAAVDTGQSVFQQMPGGFEVAPDRPPLEPDSMIEPIPDSSNEIEGTIIPTTPQLNEPETGMRQRNPNSVVPNLLFHEIISTTPRLNESETGMRQRSPNSVAPNLLFHQIQVDPVPQSTAENTSKLPSDGKTTTEKPELTEKTQPVVNPLPSDPTEPAEPPQLVEAQPAKTEAAPTNISSPVDELTVPNLLDQNKFLDMVDKLNSIDFQIRPSASSIMSPFKTSMSLPLNSDSPGIPFADRIANQIDDRAAKPASLVAAPVSALPEKTDSASGVDSKPNSSIKVPTQPGPAETGTLDPVTILQTTRPDPTPLSSGIHARSHGSSSDATDWQSRPSTLGGVLNRFRTDRVGESK